MERLLAMLVHWLISAQEYMYCMTDLPREPHSKFILMLLLACGLNTTVAEAVHGNLPSTSPSHIV